jgi:hypothetical protein
MIWDSIIIIWIKFATHRSSSIFLFSNEFLKYLLRNAMANSAFHLCRLRFKYKSQRVIEVDLRLHHQRGNLWICTGKSVPIFRYCDGSANSSIGRRQITKSSHHEGCFTVSFTKMILFRLERHLQMENSAASGWIVIQWIFFLSLHSLWFFCASNHISRFQLTRLHHISLSFFAGFFDTINEMLRTVCRHWLSANSKSNSN